jgi:hypothetical protein
METNGAPRPLGPLGQTLLAIHVAVLTLAIGGLGGWIVLIEHRTTSTEVAFASHLVTAENRFSGLESGRTSVMAAETKTRFEALDKRLDILDRRLDHLEARLDRIESGTQAILDRLPRAK